MTSAKPIPAWVILNKAKPDIKEAMEYGDFYWDKPTFPKDHIGKDEQLVELEVRVKK